ncbi:MAG: CARDB domain-containing protein, partial [Candidatus Thermoplasmatota archaeon]
SDSDNFEVIEEVEEAHFQVYNVDAPDVVEGEDLEVTATIENMGEETDTQTVDMSSPLGNDTATITLNGGEGTNETFTISTSQGDAGSYEATVSSDNDSDGDNFDVNEPAFFEVEILEYKDQIVEGEEAVFEYRVINNGSVEEAQDIEFYVDGSLVETEEGVVLKPGERSRGEFTWRTEEGDAGDYDIVIESEDDDDGVTVTVVEGAFFEIDIIDYDDMIAAGEELVVVYSVSNIGYDEGAQDIELMVEGGVEDSEFVTLSGNDEHRGEFTWQTEETGEYEVVVASEDDDEGVNVSVKEEGIFGVEIVQHDDKVTKGEQVVVEYKVVNTGDERETQDIELKVEGEVKDDRALRLESGEEEMGEFRWQPEDTGEYNVVISSEDDDDEVTVTVVGDSIFSIEIIEYPGEVSEGDEVVVEYEVTNTGEEENTQEISLMVDGDLKDSEEITLAGGRSYDSELTWETEAGDTGEREVVVASEDDDDGVTVTVAGGTYFEVEINSIENGSQFDAGDEVIVGFTVTNTGELEGTETIEFRVDDEVKDSVNNVTLSPGENEEREFIWQCEGGDHVLSVVSQNDEATVDVEVLDDAIFEVNIVEYDEEVNVGEEVVVQYTIENVGGLEGTQTIEFIVDEEVKQSIEVTLGEEESHEGEFSSWVPEHSGTYILEITTEDDSREMFLSVLEGAYFELDIIEMDEEIVEGEDAVVEYRVTNVGEVGDTVEVEFIVYDEEDNIVFEDSENITLGVDEVRESEFVWKPDEAGEYTIALMEQNETITVEEKSGSASFFDSTCGLWWLLLLIIVLSIVLLVGLMWKRRKDGGNYPTSSFLPFTFWNEEETERENKQLRTLQSSSEREASHQGIDSYGTSEFVNSENLGEEQGEEDKLGENFEEAQEDVQSLETEVEDEDVPVDSESSQESSSEEQEGLSEDEESRIDEDGFIECKECGYLASEDEDECPYCDSPL